MAAMVTGHQPRRMGATPQMNVFQQPANKYEDIKEVESNADNENIFG
jgi:hypothetical protein